MAHLRKRDGGQAQSLPGETTSPNHTGLKQWTQIPSWQQDNEYILSGYRPHTESFIRCIGSLAYIHNETINIFSHLIGAAFFSIAPAYFYTTLTTDDMEVTSADIIVFSTFFYGVSVCFLLSSTYHIISNHSPQVQKFGNQLDYLGIVILMWGSTIPSIYYGFYCDPKLQRVYWCNVSVLASLCIIATLHPNFRHPTFRPYRAAMYAGLGLSAVIFVIHGILLHGWALQNQRMSLDWMALMATFNLLGATIYAARVPEKLRPYKYDIFGSSHQILHVAVILAGLAHMIGLFRAFRFHCAQDLDEDLEDEGDTRVDSAVWLDEEYKLTGQEMIHHTPSTRRRNEYIDRTQQEDKLAGHLQPFSQFIADCPLLNEIVFQAFYGSGDSPLPQRYYLNCRDMENFVLRLPPTLKYLTLDFAGTNIVTANDNELGHLCPAIAKCISNAEIVRLRMRHICPSVFGIQSIHSSDQQSDNIQIGSLHRATGSTGRHRRPRSRWRGRGFTGGQRDRNRAAEASVNQQKLHFVMHQNACMPVDMRLSSLVVRLCLPFFSRNLDNEECMASKYPSFWASQDLEVHNLISLAAHHLLSLEHGIRNLRISYKTPGRGESVLYAIDCVRWNQVFEGIENFCYEDDGEHWEAWEDSSNLLRATIPSPAEVSRKAIHQHVFPHLGSTGPINGRAPSVPSPDDDEDVSTFADSVYPGAMAAGLEMGDIKDLLDHDMIFGSDHIPI
ncbi:MAG: hypothetical protein Q9198_003564 [Flavoplaca austrocitrina]